MSSPVTLSVPMPLKNVDAELNTMAMLAFVMRYARREMTSEEQVRISAWFASKYGNPETDQGAP